MQETTADAIQSRLDHELAYKRVLCRTIAWQRENLNNLRAEIEATKAELEAAKADIAMFIQKEVDAEND